MRPIMLIDNKEYKLDEVRLTFELNPDPRVDLFCHSHDDPGRAGIALNCISLVDSIKRIKDLERTVVLIGYRPKPGEVNIANNEYNELAESAITRGTEHLDLIGLRIEFGDIQGEMIDVKLTALCFVGEMPTKGNTVHVSAEFRAAVESVG